MKSTFASRTLHSVLNPVVVLSLSGIGVNAMAATSASNLAVRVGGNGVCLAVDAITADRRQSNIRNATATAS